MKTIKKGYLYGTEGGTTEMSYEEWANEHIQDSEVALSIAENMLRDPELIHENFNIMEKCFEVYTIIDIHMFQNQMNEYEGNRDEC